MEEDFHRYYIPYRKLIGKKVIKMYDKIIETKIPINRNFLFSTPKHNLSNNYEQNLGENLKDIEVDDLNDQILSLNSFVQVLLGNDTQRQETEVLCKYLDNEKAVRKHFKKLTNHYEKYINNNNNSENFTDTQDYTKEFDDSHNEESFVLEEMDYTREHDFFQDSTVNDDKSSNDQRTSSIHNEVQMNDLKSLNTQAINENANIKNQKANNKETIQLLKYSLTSVENQHMVSKENKLTLKELNVLKLDDLYNHSSSFSNENTTTSACLNCCEMSEDAKTSEGGSECFSSPAKEPLCDKNYFDKVSKDVNDLNENSELIDKPLYEYSRERSYESSKKSQNTAKSSLASDV